MKRTLKTVYSRINQCCSKFKTVLRDNHVNIESKSLELTIYLYICSEREAPISCKTTVYLSVSLQYKNLLLSLGLFLSMTFKKKPKCPSPMGHIFPKDQMSPLI